MSDKDTMFNNPEKAFAIIMHLGQAHEVIVESIADMCKSSLIPLLPVIDNFMSDLDALSIPEKMMDNITNTNEIRENLANVIESGNDSRYHYDLYVMEITDSIRNLISIGLQQTNLIFNDYSIELSNTVEDVEQTGDEFRELLSTALNQAIDLSKQYAHL
jgi:hypothetical protein